MKNFTKLFTVLLTVFIVTASIDMSMIVDAKEEQRTNQLSEEDSISGDNAEELIIEIPNDSLDENIDNEDIIESQNSLAIDITSSTQPFSGGLIMAGYNKRISEVSSGELTSYANSLIYRTGSSTGIDTSSNWCVRFVKKCYNEIGVSLGSRECVGEYIRDAIDNSTGIYYSIDRSNDVDLNDAVSNVIDVDKQDFVPNKGDLICFLWYGYRNYNGNYDHIGIVTDVSDDYLTYIDGNSSAGSFTTIVEHTINWRTYSYVAGYFRPNYKDSNTPPIGWFDVVDGGNGKIHVVGWAFDPDDPQNPVAIHVYIGNIAGSGAECYEIIANKERKDVDAIYHCGNNHGFDETIDVKTLGTQNIYVYAIDRGRNPQTNPQLKNSPLVTSIAEPVKVPSLKDKVFRRKEVRSVKNWIIDANDKKPTRFVSSDNKVLKVNKSTGRTQVLKSGTAIVTVYFGKESISHEYTVALPEIPDNVTVKKGSRVRIPITNLQPEDNCRAKSSNKNVVKTYIDENGKIVFYGNAKGTTTVKLLVDGVTYGKCKVTVK